MLRSNCKFLLLLSFFITSQAFAAINFGSRNSSVKIADGATLDIQSASMAVTDGSIVKRTVGSSVVGNNINFTRGILEDVGTESLLTAEYDPTDAYDAITLGNDARLRGEPGEVLQAVTVSGNNSLITGQPTFRQNITLDANATLTLAINSKLNKNITMAAGGSSAIQLGDDLALGDDIVFENGGKVQLNKKQLAFGGKDLNWTSTMVWEHASDIVMNSKISMKTTWTFDGDGYLNGNGNTLDLTNGGTIWVRHDSTLYLTDIKVKGVGTGHFVMERNTSKLHLSNVEIEMDDDWTFTEGTIFSVYI